MRMIPCLRPRCLSGPRIARVDEKVIIDVPGHVLLLTLSKVTVNAAHYCQFENFPFMTMPGNTQQF